MSSIVPVDLGFAEFVAALVSETLDAVIASTATQLQDRRGMLAAVDVPIEDYAASNVSDAEVDRAARTLFPDDARGTTVRVGEPPPEPDRLEQLEVVIERGDVRAGKLTKSGVDAVRRGLRRLVAYERLGAFRELAGEGIPRVLPETVRIVARVNFKTVMLTPDDAAPQTTTAGRRAAERTAADAPSAAVDPPLVTFHAVGTPLDFSQLRIPMSAMMAGARPSQTPAGESVPDTVRLTVSTAGTADASRSSDRDTELHGEVEIHFRTVFGTVD